MMTHRSPPSSFRILCLLSFSLIINTSAECFPGVKWTTFSLLLCACSYYSCCTHDLCIHEFSVVLIASKCLNAYMSAPLDISYLPIHSKKKLTYTENKRKKCIHRLLTFTFFTLSLRYSFYLWVYFKHLHRTINQRPSSKLTTCDRDTIINLSASYNLLHTLFITLAFFWPKPFIYIHFLSFLLFFP